MKKLLTTPTLLCLTAVGLHAATLSLGSRNLVSENNQNFNISVNPGNQSYDNTGTLSSNPPLVTTTLGTVSDYKFFHSPSETIVPYASGGSRISDAISAAGNINGSGENWSNVWTTSDPGGNLAAPTSAKDFTSGSVPRTFARSAEVDGTIDISSLASGTIHVPHGTFINQWTLTLTMTGVGETAIVALDTQAANGPGTNLGWITDFSFTNEGQYDTIEYNYTNADRDGSRARFMGLILSDITLIAIPEPSTTALLGLGGLTLILRRRK